MRRLQLIRSEDVSGCSGCGVVAEGVLWTGSHVNTTWLITPFGENRYSTLAALEEVHGRAVPGRAVSKKASKRAKRRRQQASLPGPGTCRSWGQ